VRTVRCTAFIDETSLLLKKEKVASEKGGWGEKERVVETFLIFLS